jgi:hypothetical protein
LTRLLKSAIIGFTGSGNTGRDAKVSSLPRKVLKMTAKAKVLNYTPEQTEKAKADYLSGVTVEKIAAELGKSARSIIAKLSKEGVYKAKEYVSKSGEKPMKKDAHADAIGLIAGLTESETESLTKANKTALVKIMAVFQRANDAITAAAVDAVESE